jgi:DNA-binding transcriptional MerR regulator
MIYLRRVLMSSQAVEIPDRTLFRQPEVCEIAQVQPYVLRSWEAEFPDLGVAKTANGPRVYRREDLERVLRIKHLLFVEGLTLAGARRKLEGEQKPTPVDPATLDFDMLAGDARERILAVKRGLRELQVMLAQGSSVQPRPEAFELAADPAPAPPKAAKKRKKG